MVIIFWIVSYLLACRAPLVYRNLQVRELLNNLHFFFFFFCEKSIYSAKTAAKMSSSASITLKPSSLQVYVSSVEYNFSCFSLFIFNYLFYSFQHTKQSDYMKAC